MEGKLYERLAIVGIAVVILGAIFRQCWNDASSKSVSSSKTPQSTVDSSVPVVAGDPGDPQTIYRYILHVIRYGSNRLHFPGGVMEGGYLSEADAPKVACYVMELGGHKCPHPYPKDAAMFYTSVCGGCHGNDGKGLHGAYPDLTRPTLLGIGQMMGK